MDFREEQPIFLQIAERLRDGILSDAYPEGGQIPSITEFSVAYKINPATALKGVNLLVDAGLVYKKRGVGMFVKEGAKALLTAERRERFYGERLLPAIREAKQLGIALNALMEMTERGYDQNDDQY